MLVQLPLNFQCGTIPTISPVTHWCLSALTGLSQAHRPNHWHPRSTGLWAYTTRVCTGQDCGPSSDTICWPIGGSPTQPGEILAPPQKLAHEVRDSPTYKLVPLPLNFQCGTIPNNLPRHTLVPLSPDRPYTRAHTGLAHGPLTGPHTHSPLTRPHTRGPLGFGPTPPQCARAKIMGLALIPFVGP